MNIAQLPIGVFDSGMGGLTVLRALKRRLKKESFIYLGDTARLPYGTKSAATVQQYALQMARVLVERQIKALVIACNTATTAALSHLQSVLVDIPVLGVVLPGACAAVGATHNGRIRVLATETTIASQAYQRFISQQLPTATITSRACSLLVALAEEGMVSNTIAQETLKYYLSDLEEEDTLLLGCTHFPVFTPLLKTLLPERVRVVDSAEATALALQTLLFEKALLKPVHTSDTVNSINAINAASAINLADSPDAARLIKPTSSGNLASEANNQSVPSHLIKTSNTITYCVTDSVQRFQRVGEIFLGEPLEAGSIELINAGLQTRE